LWAGQTHVAIEHFERSLRLNPLRRAPANFGIAVGYFFARRLEKAAAMLPLSLQEHPNWPPCLRFLASCYAHTGRLDDGGSIVEKLRQITPVLVPSAEHWRVREDREFFLDGLRLAVDQTARPGNATPGKPHAGMPGISGKADQNFDAGRSRDGPYLTHSSPRVGPLDCDAIHLKRAG
jgi:hypothetical protein